jgi:hypothetical protein
MSDAVLIALITMVGTICTTIIGAVVLIQTRSTSVKADVVVAKTLEIAKSVDGMKTDLVKASIGQATAEGQLAGEQAQRDRQAPPESQP